MLTYKDYIYAIYQERSFSKAARRLYVSQPWLSATVKKVEKTLQTPIFNRATNPISLTESGEYYIRQIERVMKIEEEMRQYYSELNSTANTHLCIGSSMFFCTYVLPKLTEPFQMQFPQVTLTFREGDIEDLKLDLLENKLDFILEAEQPEDSRLVSSSWVSEEIILAVPARAPINRQLEDYRYTFDELLKRNEPGGKKPPVPLLKFKNEPFLFLRPGNDIHHRSISLCGQAGFTPQIKLYLSQMMTAYYLVCEGQGSAFLRSTIPEYVTPTDSVVFYQIDHPLAMRNIYLTYSKRHTNPVQRHMIDFFQETVLEEQL